MGKNPGKKFEEDFIKSVPDRCDITRLKDAGGWSDATNMRFTSNNPCDFIIYSNRERAMYKFELKSTALKSFPFSNIKDHQLVGMLDAQNKGVRAYFVLNFRATNQTFRVLATDIQHCINTLGRKSLPLSWLLTHARSINQSLIRVRYRYDLEWL
jgi:recombination protein U